MISDGHAPRAAVVQAQRNEGARAALIDEFGALRAEDVGDLAGSRAKDRSALARRWRREQRVIGVEHDGATVYPRFQFDARGRPRPVIAEVLRHFATSRLTSWERALWFTSANGWLDGRRPVDRIETAAPGVVAAAQEAAREPVG